ncbi:MAG: hypothetical protein M1812_006548 [Candelaria pacifica]|nr:MAG: hypothetical protein M1812_006548 [Candelaria pacifica]
MASVLSSQVMYSNMSSTSAVAGKSSPTESPKSANGGLFSKITNLFSLSPTAQAFPPSPSQATSGNGRHNRKFGLKPYPKAAHDEIIKQKSYNTRRGRLHVPNRPHARRPASDLIESARRGELKGFLANGEIIPAGEFQETVNPVTAEILVDPEVCFETDHLSDDDESMDEDLRDSSNLYYIAVNSGELPTYHFWRKHGEEDPMEHSKPTDWGKVSVGTLPDMDAEAPMTEEFGNSFKNFDTGKLIQDPTTLRYDPMPGVQKYNPKRSYYPDPRKEIQWENGDTLAGKAFQTINSGIAEGSRQHGPQPGDEVWERAETEWECRLHQLGLATVLEQYKKTQPTKYRELTSGANSSPLLKPEPGRDDKSVKLNAVLKTSIPTVAFKLTQQTFDRTASPLKGNEPLARGESPRSWEQSAVNEESLPTQRVHHHVDPLEFLDFYNEKANGQIILRRRKPIPEEYIIRDQPYAPRVAQETHLDQLYGHYSPMYAHVRTMLANAAAKVSRGKERPLYGRRDLKTGKLLEKRSLIHSDRGALFLPDQTYTTFLKIVRRSLTTPGVSLDRVTRFIVDIGKTKSPVENIQSYEFDTNDDGAMDIYRSKIVPKLGKPSVLIRVRTHDADSDRPMIPKEDSTRIELRNIDVGLVYLSADWTKLEDDEFNNHQFYEAIRFLFPKSTGAFRYTLETTWSGSYDINASDPSTTLSQEARKLFLRLVKLRLSESPQIDITEHPSADEESEALGTLAEAPVEPSVQKSPEQAMILKPAREEKAWFARPFDMGNFDSTLRDQLGLKYNRLTNTLPFQVWLSHEDYHSNKKPIILSDKSDRNSTFKEHIQPYVKPGNVLYVVQTLPQITVYYGPNRFGKRPEEWPMPRTKEKLLRIAGVLFDKHWKTLEGRIYLQVARFQGEWLSYDSNTPEDQFRKEVLDKIDHREINMYPHNWVSSRARRVLAILTVWQNREEPFSSILPEKKKREQGIARNKAPHSDLAPPRQSASDEPQAKDAPGAERDTPPGYEEMVKEGKRAAMDQAKKAKKANIDKILEKLNRKRASRTTDETVHRPEGDPEPPTHGLAQEETIGPNSDLPTGYANVLTAAEIRALREENQKLQNIILERTDDQPQTETCPFCQVDWKQWNDPKRRLHIEENHLKNDRQEDQEICPYPHCRANVIHLSAEEKERHYQTHIPRSDNSRPAVSRPASTIQEPRPSENQSTQPELPIQPSGEEDKSVGEGRKSKVARHCLVCWTNVTSFSAKRKQEHLKECGRDGVEDLVDLNVNEGKRRRKYVKENGKDAPLPPKDTLKENETKEKEKEKKGRSGKTGESKPTDKVKPPTKAPAKPPAKIPPKRKIGDDGEGEGQGGKAKKHKPTGDVEAPTKSPPKRKRGDDGNEGEGRKTKKQKTTEKAKATEKEPSKSKKGEKQKETNEPKATKARTTVNFKMGPHPDATTAEAPKSPRITRKRARESSNDDNDDDTQQPPRKGPKLKLLPPKPPKEAEAKEPPKKRGRPKKK